MLSCQSLLHSQGYYRIVLFTFCVEVGMAVTMLLLGPQHYYILAVFLTVNMWDFDITKSFIYFFTAWIHSSWNNSPYGPHVQGPSSGGLQSLWTSFGWHHWYRHAEVQAQVKRKCDFLLKPSHLSHVQILRNKWHVFFAIWSFISSYLFFLFPAVPPSPPWSLEPMLSSLSRRLLWPLC